MTAKEDSVWQSISTSARNLDWTVNRVSSSEEALECFHKGNGLPAVAFIDCRNQNDKTVDAYQIARYVMVISSVVPKYNGRGNRKNVRRSDVNDTSNKI